MPISTSFLRRLPKTELHLHLEGSIQPSRLLALARKYETEYSNWTVEAIASDLFKYRDFLHFLDVYRIVCQHLREPQDYLDLLDDLYIYFDSNNVRYAEVIVTPSIPWKLGGDGAAVVQALTKSSQDSPDKCRIRWILDCVRQFGPDAAQQTAELAVALLDKGVVAIGLGGDENSVPAQDFEETFNWARANALHIHVHAGETRGPESVWEALQILGANRIGHGIQAARDSQLMEYLKNHAIALDVCLTSNFATGVWRPLSDNPFKLLHKRGVPVTLSTDDPGLFHTTLLMEYQKAVTAFHLDAADLSYIILQGVRSAFLPHTEKMELMQQFQDHLFQLRDTEPTA